MLIKCPQCATSYDIPEAQMEQKARKMRCSRCKTIFAVARRGASLPPGYEEFAATAQSALPDEFAFLKQTPQKEEAPVVVEPERKERRYEETILGVYQPGGEPSKRDSKTPMPDTEQKSKPRYDSEQINPGIPMQDIAPPKPAEPVPIEPPQEESLVDRVLREAREKKAATISQPPVPSGAADAYLDAHGEIPTPLVVKSDSTPAPLASEPPKRPSRPDASQTPISRTPSQGVEVPDFYGYQAQAWETEVPLDLDRFAVESSSGTAQAVGKLMTILTVVIVAFFIFVGYRNGWSLSYDEIGKQVSIAFSLEQNEKPPKEAESIEVTVDERRMLFRNKDEPMLVVTGKVFNNAPLYRTHIVLRGRLFDARGEMRSQIRFPCDKIIEDAKLKEASRGTVANFFKKEGELHNCTIPGESNTFYQLVFEDVPPDYDESFSLEVDPIYARARD
jgi:predicted Zn finger-like uncharacterized protein